MEVIRIKYDVTKSHMSIIMKANIKIIYVNLKRKKDANSYKVFVKN
jgi:hypothetical protein